MTKGSVVKGCLHSQDDFFQFMPAQVTVSDCFVRTLLYDAFIFLNDRPTIELYWD